jgi:hypothetical protein
MEQGETEFKRGSDLTETPNLGSASYLSCESCGGHAEQGAASDLGWQVRPPVCPDCLRWSATDSEAAPSLITIRPRGRYWSVYDRGELICVTVYRKGAEAVAARLTADRRSNGHGRG